MLGHILDHIEHFLTGPCSWIPMIWKYRENRRLKQPISDPNPQTFKRTHLSCIENWWKTASKNSPQKKETFTVIKETTKDNQSKASLKIFTPNLRNIEKKTHINSIFSLYLFAPECGFPRKKKPTPCASLPKASKRRVLTSSALQSNGKFRSFCSRVVLGVAKNPWRFGDLYAP